MFAHLLLLEEGKERMMSYATKMDLIKAFELAISEDKYHIIISIFTGRKGELESFAFGQGISNGEVISNLSKMGNGE